MATPIYSSLSSEAREIRLILLAPAENRSDPINCELNIVSLDERPHYKALSYVWGNASDTSTIQVCSQDFEATKNLEAAMRRIRDQKSPLIIWVDAICINQKDIQERNSQVSMMRSIYKDAVEEVLAYLGKGNLTHNDNAFETIIELGKDINLHWDSSLEPHINPKHLRIVYLLDLLMFFKSA
jgi:hypothetical protein